MNRFAAKLLFQFRVAGQPNKRVFCEERIVVYDARSPAQAISLAKGKFGKQREYHYENASHATVRVEFVGVMDMIDLGSPELRQASPEEVWYDFKDRLTPMVRRKELTIDERKLLRMLGGRPRKPKTGQGSAR
jgi:hypothetical protein